jgi:tRNA nucleotidyltransferase (CCA-adding enzyme)
VYDDFFKDKHIGRMERFKKRIRKWVKQDYGVDIQLHTLEDLKKFRAFIISVYKNEYHELFPKTGYCFSEHGWVTLWVTKHMEMEIEANEHQTS